MTPASRITAVSVSLTFLFALIPALSLANEPTTAEERSEAVRLAGELELNPLGEESNAQRELLLHWWREIPDLSLRWCESLMLELAIGDEQFTRLILVQAVLSGGAYMIEHPEAANEPRTVWVAGIAGALRTYRRAIELDPELKSKALDELVELEKSGTLAEYVEPFVPQCEN